MPTQAQQAAARELLDRRRARAGLLAFTKYTFPRFKENWHHALMCEYIDKLDFGTLQHGDGAPCKRLMVFAPPRHTKSELISIRRPAWSIGRDPTRMFINVTYGSDLAYTFSRACRNTIKSTAYGRLFPDIAMEREATERWKVKRTAELENQRDSMIASGILSPLTGEGATDINVDDPFKNKSEAYSKTIRDRVYDEYLTSIRTRLQPNGTITLMLTRWHDDDLAGRLLKAAASRKKSDQWIVLVLAATNVTGKDAYIYDTRTGTYTYLDKYDALWPAWFSAEDLEATRATTSPAFWEAMYMQRPSTAQGSIFLRDKWTEFLQPTYLERCVHVWDTAMQDTENADYSAFEELGLFNGRFLINDADRGQLSFPELVAGVYKKWNRALQRGYNVPERLLIENKASGISLIQTIEANNADPTFTGPRIPVLGMPATLNKTVRALSISGYQNSGLVGLPVSLTDEDCWHNDLSNVPLTVADFIDEHSAFDKGKNDDLVDCTTHALTYFTRPIQGLVEEEILIDGEDYTVSSELDQADNQAAW